MPPDILGCTPYPAAEWPKVRDTFLALCADDFACKPNLAHFKAVIDTWSYPSDAGTCATWVTAQVYDIDAEHDLPAKASTTGKPEKWKDIANKSFLIPAKEYARLETYVQKECHDKKHCGSIGNWQKASAATDSALKVQAEKVERLK